MSPKYWMITNRAIAEGKITTGNNIGLAPDTFWITDSDEIDNIKNWKQLKGDDFNNQLKEFQSLLIKSANKFPLIENPDFYDQQKHISLLIHGFDNDWKSATKNYKHLCDNLFIKNKLGICILFTWPSFGSPLKYISDREQAKESSFALAEMLYILNDWLDIKHKEAKENPNRQCRAKTSIICHSMGNYVLQNAMQMAWTKRNRPENINLIDQLIMVAADINNDIFMSGENNANSDGDAIAYLSYRITALFTGKDNILGSSAGLKHFGKRRLGRNGLDKTYPTPDNVWDIDCTDLIKIGKPSIHSCYFYEEDILRLFEDILRGTDRNIIKKKYKF